MEKEKWVNGWGLGVTHPPLSEAQWSKDTTVRYILLNSLTAKAIRLSFTNRFGDHPAHLSAVTVAISVNGKCTVDSESMTFVTFNGKNDCIIPPHGDVTSDEIPFSIRSGEKLAVSIYFGDFVHMNTGFTYPNKYMVRRFIAGNHVSDNDFDQMQVSFSAAYNFLWSIDFLVSSESFSVAAFGDSITSQEWVDIVAQKLSESSAGNRAIVRRAVSGSRIFGCYPALSYYHYGEDGKTRFEREVMHPGVRSVIILHGINDLIHPDGKNPLRPMSNMPSADQMLDGLLWYVRTAQSYGLKAYLGTLLPIKGWRTYDIARDDIRIAVNSMIRSQTVSDGVIDFEAAVRDKDDARAFDPVCNSGDSLHPSIEGYRRMANAVPMEIFE
jgi:hypothetical protein